MILEQQIKHYTEHKTYIENLNTIEKIESEINRGKHKSTLINDILGHAGENKLDIVVFKKLIDNGADMNHELLILKLACYEYWDGVFYLIEKGADIYVKDETLLELVSYSGNIELIEILLNKGFNIHRDNENPLSEAIIGENVETIEYYLNKGCNLDNCLKNHYFYIDKKEVLEYLIEKNVDVKILKDRVKDELKPWIDMTYLDKKVRIKNDELENSTNNQTAKKVKL